MTYDCLLEREAWLGGGGGGAYHGGGGACDAATRHHILRLLGPRTILYKAFRIFEF